jgi:G3E family GTPase
VILLNKADLVPADELEALEARLRAMNPTAVIHRSQSLRRKSAPAESAN